MKLSPEGLRFIAGEEGFVGHIYADFAGVATIGFGHVVRPDERYVTLTRDDALQLLSHDVQAAEEHVTLLVRVPLEQSQFDALVSFTFNEGGRALANSTLLIRLNAGNIEGAADELLKWNKYRAPDGVLRTSDTLTARRAKERAMFMRDVETKPDRVYSPNVQPAAVGEVDRPSSPPDSPPESPPDDAA